MKIPRLGVTAVIIVTVIALGMPQLSTRAADLQTVTPLTVVISEAQINASYWVTNPSRRWVTNRHVTLGDGIVTISETITVQPGKPYNVVTVWKPWVTSGGVLVFGFQSLTINGVSATPKDRAKWSSSYHRYMVRDAIRDYIRRQVHGTFKLTGIVVSPGQVAISVNVYTA